ncbi:unnamed protein product [Rhodiola kirilowii]
MQAIMLLERFLGQRVDKKFHAIHYTSKVLNGAQLHYSTTEKELLEFDIEIKDKKGVENLVADHLSRLEGNEELKEDTSLIDDTFIGEQLMRVEAESLHGMRIWTTFVVCGIIPHDMNHHQKRKFLSETKKCYWDEPFLYRLCADGIYRTCVAEEEMRNILYHCHSSLIWRTW